MKLTLTTLERFLLIRVLGNVEGRLAQMRLAARLMDRVEFTSAEKELVGVREVSPGTSTWTDAEKTWDIEFPDGNEIALLQAVYPQYEWSGVPAAAVTALADKFGVKE